MTQVSQLFPSKFVAAGDLPAAGVEVQIEKWAFEKVGIEQEQRPILFFLGKQKGMVLNVTNANRIAEMYGTEVDAWCGKTIHIYPSETDFAGKTVPCIRVRAETAPVVTNGTDSF